MNKRQFAIAAVLFLVVFGFPFYKACNFLSEFNNEFSHGFAGEGKGEFEVIKNADSPDGKYTAIFWSGMGGGAAGWCEKSINVYKKEEIFDMSKREENRKTKVFDVRCSGSSDVDMNWESANHLQIAFSVAGGTGVSMEDKTANGDVKVSYKIK